MYKRQVLAVVEDFQRLKRGRDAMDFADQVALAARLARTFPDIGAAERGRYRAVLLDEPVSALDATVRARILALLDRLQRDRGLTMLLVSHDLGVIAAVADDLIVMQDGAIVEQGPCLLYTSRCV